MFKTDKNGRKANIIPYYFYSVGPVCSQKTLQSSRLLWCKKKKKKSGIENKSTAQSRRKKSSDRKCQAYKNPCINRNIKQPFSQNITGRGGEWVVCGRGENNTNNYCKFRVWKKANRNQIKKWLIYLVSTLLCLKSDFGEESNICSKSNSQNI